MSHQTSSIITKDGLKLFTQSWPVEKSRAHLILIHGLAEHSSRYQWAAEKFNDSGISVYTFDQRGHGQSEGERAYVKSFEDYYQDLNTFIESLELETNIFLLGHSMGGLIVTRYLLAQAETKCQGVILSAPALKVGDDISPVLVKASAIISSVLPKLKATKLDAQYISRDPQVVEDYNNDPLNYREGIKARLGAEMIKAMQELRGSYPDFTFPVLVMHGSGDKLADLQGSRWMIDEIGSKDKTLEVLPGFYHEILNEPEKEAVIGKMIEWIKKRV